MNLTEKFFDFTTLGVEVEHEGKKVRPDTRTSIAVGKVSQIEEAGKGNLRVGVKVSGAKYGFAGFINDNTTVSKLLEQAKENDLVIGVRFEKKRKKGVDPTELMSDLAKDAETAKENITNIVSGVYNFNDKEWILTDESVSNPKEDPAEITAGINKLVMGNTDNFFDAPKQKLNTTDSDQKANHLLTMHGFAEAHAKENGLTINTKTLAINMLTACDRLQMIANNLSAPNYNDYSHTKSRGLLFSWMEINALTEEIVKEKGGFNKWITRFLNESEELWAWAQTEAGVEK